MFGQEFDLGRRAGEEHVAGEGFGHFAKAVDDTGFDHGAIIDQRHAAPLTDGIAALFGVLDAIKGKRIDRLAIDKQLHALPAAMADRDAHGRRARIGIKRGGKEAVLAVTHAEIIGHHGRRSGRGRRRRGGCNGRRLCCVFSHNRVEIGDHKTAALPDGKA